MISTDIVTHEFNGADFEICFTLCEDISDTVKKTYSVVTGQLHKNGGDGVRTAGKKKIKKGAFKGLLNTDTLEKNEYLIRGIDKNRVGYYGSGMSGNLPYRGLKKVNLNEPENTFLLIDVDRDDSDNSALRELFTVCPELEKAARIVHPSSTACLRVGDTVTPLKKHIYLPVCNARPGDIEAIGYGLSALLIERGFYHESVNMKSYYRIETIIDMTALRKTQPIYEGPPDLGEGVTSEKPEPIFVDGGVINAPALVSSLPSKVAFERAKHQARASYMAINKEHVESIEKGAKKRLIADEGFTEKEATKQVNVLLAGGGEISLSKKTIIHFSNGESHTVAKLRTDNFGARLDNLPCGIPVRSEPQYHKGGGQFHYDNGECYIYCFHNSGPSYIYFSNLVRGDKPPLPNPEPRTPPTMVMPQIARQNVSNAVADAFNYVRGPFDTTKRATVIKSSCGIGKSHAVKKEIINTDKRVLIVTRENKISAEYVDDLIGGGLPPSEVNARFGSGFKSSMLDEYLVKKYPQHLATTCPRFEHIEKVTSVPTELCKQCPQKAACPRKMREMSTARVQICTYSMLNKRKTGFTNFTPDIIVADETFIDQMPATVVTESDVKNAGNPVAQDIFDTLNKCKTFDELSKAYTDLLYRHADVIESHLKYTYTTRGSLVNEHSTDEALERFFSFSPNNTPDMVRLFIDSTHRMALDIAHYPIVPEHLIDANSDSKKLHIIDGENLLTNPNDYQQLLFLDGTAKEAVCRNLFARYDDLKFIEVNATPINTFTIQRANGKRGTTTTDPYSRYCKKTSRAKSYIRSLNDQSFEGLNYFWAGHKQIEDKHLSSSYFKQKMHFNAVRGSNAAEGCSHAFISGYSWKAPSTFKIQALTIGTITHNIYNLAEAKRNLSFVGTGGKNFLVGSECFSFQDDFVHDLYMSSVAGEAVQAAYRIRPYAEGKKFNVIAFDSSHPVDVPIDAYYQYLRPHELAFFTKKAVELVGERTFDTDMRDRVNTLLACLDTLSKYGLAGIPDFINTATCHMMAAYDVEKSSAQSIGAMIRSAYLGLAKIMFVRKGIVSFGSIKQEFFTTIADDKKVFDDVLAGNPHLDPTDIDFIGEEYGTTKMNKRITAWKYSKMNAKQQAVAVWWPYVAPTMIDQLRGEGMTLPAAKKRIEREILRIAA